MSYSIIIPTWNNLPFLKLCVESIRKNSSETHQIIVHVNEGSDGTLSWVREQGLDYTFSERNIGVCMACNRMRSKVRNEYIVYLNDDMYVLPGWDAALQKEVDVLPDHLFCLSGTMIQPHNALDVGIVADYGDSVANFQEERLLGEYMDYPMEDWLGSTWPPVMVHRDLWDLVGGYSIEFSPGMYSDPDFTAKLWMAGVRHFKGLGQCRVYHFETKSTGRIRKNNGNLQFLMKWGVTNSVMRKQLTHLGEGAASDVGVGEVRRAHRMKARAKALWALLTGKQFGPLWRLGEDEDARN
ncbi:MAG: glycosyltransferase [Bacteroidales bacterium]|nr:glycosyltransferase [Bacteroidales bacterium]